MRDGQKTKAQLLLELADMQLRVAALETLEGERQRAEERLDHALRREEALGRLRDQVIAAFDMPTLLATLETACKKEMIGLGIPVSAISLQLPAQHMPGEYVSLRLDRWEKSPSSVRSLPVSESAWVSEAWETGDAVVVHRDQIAASRFGTVKEMRHTQSLAEIPLQELDGGSVGIASAKADAFEAEALKTAEMFVRFIGLGLRRVRASAAMKQAEEHLDRERRLGEAEAALRLRIAEMREPQHLVVVAEEIERQVRELDIQFSSCSVQVINEPGDDFVSITGDTLRSEHPLWSDGLAWSRVSRDATKFPWVTEAWRTGAHRYDPHVTCLGAHVRSVVDVPFSQGTVAVNSFQEDAFTQHDIEALQRLADVLSEGFQRYQDLFEQRRIGEQLVQSQKMEAIGQLAGGVAHDLNNVLTAILGGAAFITRKLEADHPSHQYVEVIRNAGEHASSLTRQLLAFSRRQILEPRILDLNTVVAETDKMLQRLIGEHLDLVTSLGVDLGQVEADPGQVE